MNSRQTGILAALSSAFFLGMAPIFGKQAILAGMHWSEVVALRTVLATLLLLIGISLRNRRFLYIYPAGLLGCFLAGMINGVGSLLYYGSLARINASLGQLLYSLYPLFVLIWLWLLDHQPPRWLTLLRLTLVIPGVYLLTRAPLGNVDLVGVLMMLGAAALYALHLPINQRVLYEMPAPTVTLYTLTAMSLIVIPAFLISSLYFGTAQISTMFKVSFTAWQAVLGLTLVTFFSRLTLFLGVKHLGGLQTALLGIAELLITLLFSHLVLRERLAITQWIGVGLLLVSLLLISIEKTTPRRFTGGWLSWLRPPNLPKDLPLP